MPNHTNKAPGGSPSASSAARQRIRSPWSAVDAAKIREVLTRAVESTRGSSPTPAMDFGRYVRHEVERSPDRVEGIFAMARLLKCDPTGQEIESLKQDMADLKTRVGGQAPANPSSKKQLTGRHGLKSAGSDKPRTARKTEKRTTRKQASKLLRQLEKQVLREVREEFGQPSESVIEREMVERVFSKSDAELTAILHERFDFPLSGRKTLYRTPEYTSWAPYRVRGNSRRLDPESPAVDATAAGGESSASGATRTAGYLAENGLSERRFCRIRPLDAEGRRKIDDDPEARAFALKHPEFFSEDVEPCG